MRILGIDPGLATVGYGVIDVTGTRALSCVSYGCIKTSPDLPLASRLHVIFEDMQEVIERYNPDEASVEKLFFNTNVTTGISVSHARGVILLSLVKKEIPLYEYTPLQIKSGVLGYGRGEKKQIQYIVTKTLKLNSVPKPDDAADGLAVAICHYYSRMKEIFKL